MQEKINDQRVGIAILLHDPHGFTQLPLKDGYSSLDYVKQAIEGYDRAEKAIVFVTEGTRGQDILSNKFKQIKKVKPTIFNTLASIYEEFMDFDHLILLWGDSPLFLKKLMDELLSLHLSEMADYSFCENFFDGMGVEILSYYTLNKLKNVASGNDEALSHNSIYKLVELDINSYDIETIVSDPDLRYLRVSLIADNPRNTAVLAGLFHGIKKDHANLVPNDLVHLIQSDPVIIRPFPAYVEIEITNQGNPSSVLNPLRVIHREQNRMSLDDYKSLVENIANWSPDTVIGLAGAGDPLTHPDFVDMVRETLRYDTLSLLVETEAHHLSQEISDQIAGQLSQRFMMICKISASNSKLYQQLYSTDDFDTVEQNIVYLLKKNPDYVYLQYTRLKDNDEDYDAFKMRWKSYEDNIIFVSYNDYCGLLQDKSSIELSPITRFPCWHLRRSMMVLADGQVSLCPQDVQGNFHMGNVKNNDLEDIWNKGMEIFYGHFQEKYPPLCQKCQQWYVWYF